MGQADLSRWDLWTLIAVLTEEKQHAFWDTRVDEVRERLEAGADPDAGRFAPLRLAASMGHLPICKVLLEYGADVHGGCRYRTPLAASIGFPDVESLLLEHGATETVFTAVARGNADETRRHLAQDPSLADVRDEDDMTPLFLAAGRRDIELMSILLEAGADPNVSAKSSYGISPIHQLARGGGSGDGPAAIALLTRHGADLDARDKGGVTALHMAVRARDLPVVKALLEHGAAVDVEDRGRRSTPLRRAVANTGRPGTSGKQDVAIQIVASLLEHGADPGHVNRSGKSMLESTRHAGIRALLDAALSAR